MSLHPLQLMSSRFIFCEACEERDFALLAHTLDAGISSPYNAFNQIVNDVSGTQAENLARQAARHLQDWKESRSHST